MAETRFEFENLEVWHKSMDLTNQIIQVLDNTILNRSHFKLFEQLEAAAASVPANIAEGKGRKFDKDYLRFLYYSRGSLYETVTFLKLFSKNNWISEDEYQKLDKQCLTIGKMLNALIRSVRNRSNLNPKP
jgi:four helix bundle protein